MTTHRRAAVFGALFFALSCLALGLVLLPEAHAGSALSGLLDPHGVSYALTLAAMVEKRNKLVADMGAMITLAETEDRDLSAEEQTGFDAMKAEKDGLDKRIARLQEQQLTEAALQAVRPGVARGQSIPRAGGPEASREFESLGHFLAAVRFNPNDQRLSFVEGVGAEGGDPEMNAEFRMDNGPTGGFMVPTQFRPQIMSVQPQDALVRPRANVLEPGAAPDSAVTMPALDQTGAASKNMFGGMEFKWIAEGDEKPETVAKLREFTLTPNEVAGFITITDKLLRNWQGSAAYLENLMRQGITAMEDYSFLRGTGVGQPLGIINAGATRWVNRATANQIGYADLADMVSRLLMRGGQSPIWSMPQSALPQIAKLQDPEGHYIWLANARDGFAGTLLGYPVRWHNRSPALGSKGDVVLADWSQYVIKDGSGPFVAASEHVLFKSNKTIIKIFYNVDGAPWLTAPIQEENGWEVSPFVGLDVPA